MDSDEKDVVEDEFAASAVETMTAAAEKMTLEKEEEMDAVATAGEHDDDLALEAAILNDVWYPAAAIGATAANASTSSSSSVVESETLPPPQLPPKAKGSSSSTSTLLEAERRKWNPKLGDTTVPVVGEFKYPLEKPLGPVMCSSRLVRTHCPGLTKQMMRQGTGSLHPTEQATCFVHYDMWQLNETEQEVWSTRQEAEPHQIIVGRQDTDEKKRHHAGLSECLRAMVEGERALFRVPPRLCYGDTGNFSFPAVPPDCWMLAGARFRMRRWVGEDGIM